MHSSAAVAATEATVDIDPDTLNLASKGMMTCFIELPDEYDASNIIQDSVILNNTVCAEKAVVGDYDRDGIPDFTVKFDREQVCALLEPGDAVEITVSGTVGDVRFMGTDTIRVTGKKNGNKKAAIPECYEARNTDKVYFYHLNHLGTPQAITDEDGNIVWQADYKPFGEASVTTGDVKNNFRFPGQYYDAETGLHYNWNRYYDPDTGRYLMPDPIGLDGEINLYAYVRGNPANLTDSDGLDATLPFTWWEALIGAGEGGAAIGGGGIAFIAGGIILVTATPAGEGSDIIPGSKNIGSNPISHKREHELLDMPIPGFPQDPKDYCKDLKKAIEELTLAIIWRGKDMKDHGWHNDNPTRGGHNRFQKRLIEKRNRLQRKYDDFCKESCD